MSNNEKYNPVSLEKYINELDEIVMTLQECTSIALKINDPDVHLRVYRAEWHIRGLIYHCKNIIEQYGNFCNDVIIRANSDSGVKPDILIMYSPSVQYLMYEFYALVNLAKISLDNLSKLVYPLFSTKHLPKSVTDFESGSTNCPMYERLANDSLTHYLIDVRNCLVHYRSFATNDNAYVLKEGVDESEAQEIAKDWIGLMAKGVFRFTDDGKTVVNIFLPDVIFERSETGDKKLAKFTYDNRYNILGHSMRFARTVMFSTIEAFSYYKDFSKRFIYNKHGIGEKVNYFDFIS